MKNTWKRLLALLLALCLCVSLFPAMAFAEEPEDEPAEAEALDVPPEEEPAAEADDPDAPPAELAFVLQPEDGELPEGESYAFSWELSFDPDRQELLLEETDESGEMCLTLASELPLDARAWEIGAPGTYRVRAWLGEESALSAAFTVAAAPVDPVKAGAPDGPDDPRDDLDPAEEAAPLPPNGETDASSGTCGDHLTWTLDDAGTLTISGTGKMVNYQYDGTPWYSQRESIRCLVIQPGVTSIGSFAFYYFTNLTSVTIPSSVTRIERYAFLHCESLTDVTIPESVTSIGERAFSSCNGLTNVTIPEGVTSIGDFAFYDCGSLASVMLPSSVASIGSGAFSCDNLSDIFFGGMKAAWKRIGGVGAIDRYKTTVHCSDGDLPAAPLSACGDDLTWTLDDAGTLTITGTGSMWDLASGSPPWYDQADAIRTVVLPSGMTSIGSAAFAECYNLTSVEIPAGVTSIGYWAFGNCRSLTSVEIPSGVTCIGDSAFIFCYSLQSVTIPLSVTIIEDNAFSVCSSLQSVVIPSGVTRIGDWTFSNCSSLTSVTIPASVTSIGYYAFRSCSSLTSVTIPRSVTNIRDGAFYECGSLLEIRFAGPAPTFGSDCFYGVTATAYYPAEEPSWTPEARKNCGGDLTWVPVVPDNAVASGTCGTDLYWYLTDGGTLTILGSGAMTNYSYYSNAPWSSYHASIRSAEIRSGVTSIGAYAFYDCDSLTRVTLPSTVRSFGKQSFSFCDSLGTIALPEGVTVIPEAMFKYCALRSIRIPASVTRVEDEAFYYCTVDVVFFGGTRAQWDALSIGSDNTPLRIARIICEGDGPQGEGSETLTMRMTEGESCTFTGKAVKPAVQVYHGATLLTEGKDYTLTYKNNTKAYVLREGEEGFAAKSAPTVTVKGKGNYGGSASAHFVILPKDLGDEDISAPELCKVYNKKEQMLVPALKYGKTALKNKTDFTVQYPDGAVSGAYTEMGSWRILVVGKGNYTGSRTVILRIGKALAGSFSLSKIPAQTYTGEAICPALTVKSGKTVLTEGTDYALRYTDNVEIGTATVTVLGLGDYVGSKTASFKISGYALGKAKIALGAASKTYDGTEQTNSYTVTFTRPDKTVITLTEGTDFTVAYAKNVNVGTAQMIFTGMGRFSGTVKKSFKIVQRPMSEGVTVAAIGTVPYEKGGAKPHPVVSFGGRVLTEGKDYTLSYKNNSKVYTYPEGDYMFEAKYAPTVTIQGKGNFKGSVPAYFQLTKAQLGRVSVTAPDKVYKNKPNIYKSTPTLYDLNGKKLVAGVDYEKKFLHNYWRSTKVMYFGTPIWRSGGDYVSAYDVIPAGTRIEVEIFGKGMYEGKAFASFYITAASVGGAKVTIPAQTYTGAPIRPSGEEVVVRVGGQRLEEGKDYVIVGYENNVNKGSAKLTIRGNGNYGGTKTVTFKINARPIDVWQAAINAVSRFLWNKSA